MPKPIGSKKMTHIETDKTEFSASDVCYRAFELMHAKQYDDAEKLLAGNMAKTQDERSIALYHSALGVLFKLKHDYKQAWQHYDRAEKLLPDDPAIKIIAARLLIERFKEYEKAIRRARKVLELVPDNPVFVHQAYITIGLAELGRGKKNAAVSAMLKSMGDHFSGFISAQNIDLNLLESLLRKKYGLPECKIFLDSAKDFAIRVEEERYAKQFSSFLSAFERDYKA
ncbi:MAG: hypothetical protein COX62_07805 [Deltaproteobacteria bacterium CG_4_10_14_0_2_um_filter_43_8]|nr:MAG: hypothetical protein COV43_01230 [Deltaproteobacteria bacterium CG11_big_fil_rev_8_21_14_0_20_42_23]PJA18902.1 MAG: hypothetical protein COX62_07805 [Deltaproteobacteria bacterium CG_4_10_14_0_2_um_filter_43_8]PJC63529.1 MAG: hypothetical protein CO021_08765 [Deltaproteobacteria bacterium CG_4_9_14_0_2_um_filter_42_21]